MSQVKQYMHQLKLKRVSYEDKCECLKMIQKYGSPEDYRKGINIMRTMEEESKKKKNQKGHPKKTSEYESIPEEKTIPELEKEEVGNEPIYLNSCEEKLATSPSDSANCRPNGLLKPKKSKYLKVKCSICGKEVRNPETNKHQMSKKHLKKLEKLKLKEELEKLMKDDDNEEDENEEEKKEQE